MSPKHLERYVTEFTGRYNVKDLDTLDQMSFLAKGMVARTFLTRAYKKSWLIGKLGLIIVKVKEVPWPLQLGVCRVPWYPSYFQTTFPRTYC